MSNNLDNMIGIPYNHNYKVMKLQEYIELLETIENKFGCGFKSDAFGYRGIPDQTFSMLPSIFRGQLFDKNN